jgi:hypothetical protein
MKHALTSQFASLALLAALIAPAMAAVAVDWALRRVPRGRSRAGTG